MGMYQGKGRNRMGILIIEGNEVYELDEECLEEKKEKES